MATAYPDSYGIYANLTAGWTDITLEALSDIGVSYGIEGSGPNDRLASTGVMRFTLNNYGGHYTPGGANVLAGWKKGIGVKLVIVFDGNSFTKFRGIIDTIELRSNVLGYNVAEVTVVDWMNYAALHPIVNPALQVEYRIDHAIIALLYDMPINPQMTALDVGINDFPTVFDLVRSKTVAYSEFSKLVQSELGYLYLARDRDYGEKLVLENADHRSGLLPMTLVPVLTDASETLLTEAGETLLTETGEEILIDALTTFSFIDNLRSLAVKYGEDVINRFAVTAYPRKVDTSAVVLYSLGSPMEIGAGQTVTFTGNFVDPVGGQSAGGMSMINPVATTDYLLNTQADGLGTNLTGTAVVTADFGASSGIFTVRNPSLLAGYITKFQCRGLGIYTYDPIEYNIEDVTSIDEYGLVEQKLDQKYQDNLAYGEALARSLLYFGKQPRIVVQSIDYLANLSPEVLNAFLQFDVGSLIKAQVTAMGINGSYIIQKEEFVIGKTGVIFCTYALAAFWSLLAGSLTSLQATFGGPGNTNDAINYGYLPNVVRTSTRSYAAWVYDDGAAEDGAVLCAPFADGGGVKIHVTSLQRVRVYSNLFNVTPGWWHSPTNSLLTGAWHHIVVTYYAWDSSADPVIYIDGVDQVVTETDTPTGTLNSEYGAEVVIGNQHTDTQDYSQPWHGLLKDVRIYDRILTQTEVTELYNGGVPNALLVTDGLVFQGPVVKTDEVAQYSGHLLDASLPVLENIYRALGLSHGQPMVTTWF